MTVEAGIRGTARRRWSSLQIVTTEMRKCVRRCVAVPPVARKLSKCSGLTRNLEISGELRVAARLRIVSSSPFSASSRRDDSQSTRKRETKFRVPDAFVHDHLTLPTVPYSTTPRNGNWCNGNHLGICLSSPQKNGNSLAWVLWWP